MRFLAGNGWPWRMHATYNETHLARLDVFEKVHRDIPIDKLGWFFDHGETVTPANLERIRKLGGGIAVQNRMSMQGEYFIRRYGLKAAAETPPVKRMIEMGVPVTLGHRRHPRQQLQPVAGDLLAGVGPLDRRHGAVPRGAPPRPRTRRCR